MSRILFMCSKIGTSNITRNGRNVRVWALLILFLTINQSFAQYRSVDQSAAKAEMERFASGKRVLYMAAHPDDENTRLIAWMSNALNAETTYLSLTRGSGGQNLIGDELGADLGIIREHELRAARSVDGGNQRFTDALDFGYSKSVAEVWTKWDHKALQLQTVRTIRELQPDFIITRFPPDARAGHGHHTASAELAIECAELAADSTYDSGTKPWAVQGVWWNTSVWWDTSVKDDPEAVGLDMSGFDPLLGDTYGAIGDAARSMHKCQGFGVPINRGPREEYFKVLWGQGDLQAYFEDFENGADKGALLAADALFALEIGDRAQAIAKWAELGLELAQETAPSSDRYQRWQTVMLHIIGVYAEVYTAENPLVEAGSYPAVLQVQSLDPSVKVQVASVRAPGKNMGLNPPQEIGVDGFELEVDLKENGGITPAVRVRLEVLGSVVMLHLKPVSKMTDRAIGEYREKIAVVPAMHAKFDKTVTWVYAKKKQLGYSIYTEQAGRYSWEVVFSAGIKPVQRRSVEEELAKGWNHFNMEVPADLPKGQVTAAISVTNSTKIQWLNTVSKVSYPHIGTHYRQAMAKTKLSVLALDKKRVKLGYIEGAGDVMDETLESVGYDLVHITEETPELWNEVDAILVGIRAFNTEDWLMESGDRIAAFVAGGGNFVVTYTTAGRSGVELPLPVPLTIGRDRVTEELAPVGWQKHSLTQEPNLLTAADFEQWVQERGLYFPKLQDPWTPIFTIDESTGIQYQNSTVVAEYGKGSVIYTGLSLFRELPAGVPGALRLLQNMLHYD